MSQGRPATAAPPYNWPNLQGVPVSPTELSDPYALQKTPAIAALIRFENVPATTASSPNRAIS
ncbi:hypothetical protein HAHE_09230 [Haloferula helveola]|uniref:Uncharacterized protein n=1 Tax=Haloferula helveola TaxID=490095 RepID=A0ABN6H688_9BACT|nr:hypothetical protein HAHE_09230 [Haloferula helveola]